MRQVLFNIPFTDIPIYGYGLMLFLAYVFCTWLAGRLATRQGIDRRILSDMAIWLFVTGIIGARLTHVFIEQWDKYKEDPRRILYLWDGGLVLYGSLIGGTIGYMIFHRRTLRPAGISFLKMADIAAPCLALGIALGRIGCLFTGCCYGNVACSSCPALEFPLPSAPSADMARLGYQHAAGFAVNPGDMRVIAVEPGSPAEQAGVKPDDEIVMVNGVQINAKDAPFSAYEQFSVALLGGWPSGQRQLALVVKRDGHEVQLAFTPESLGLHPTQIYETISMFLLMFFLLAYFPYKKRDGTLLALFMAGYGLHRLLNEMLRIDNPEFILGLTFSQFVSLLVIAGAGVLAWWVFRREAPAQSRDRQGAVELNAP